jgi:hypothetical protein
MNQVLVTERQLAEGIRDGSITFTLCPPQKVSRKRRVRTAGMKGSGSRKGSAPDPRGGQPKRLTANSIYSTADTVKSK